MKSTILKIPWLLGSLAALSLSGCAPASASMAPNPTALSVDLPSDGYSLGQAAVRSADVNLTPALGSAKALVVPLRIGSDVSKVNGHPTGFHASTETVSRNGQILNPSIDWRSFLSQAFFGKPQETGWQSVQSFYAASSYGALSLSGTLAPAVDSPLDYGDLLNYPNLKKGDASHLAREALRDILSKVYSVLFDGDAPVYKVSDFDANQDGVIDALYLVYDLPHYRMASYPSDFMDTLLWSNAYSSVLPWVSSLGPVVFMSKYAFLEGYLTAKKPYQDAKGNPLPDAHAAIHETGHMLGLADYYDSSLKSKLSPMGSLTMMDRNVFDLDAYSKFFLGWIDPKRIKPEDAMKTQGLTVDLAPFESSGQAILLDVFDQADWVGEQYVLLSYWTPTGLNETDATNAYRALAYPDGNNPYTGWKTPGVVGLKVDSRFSNNGRFMTSADLPNLGTESIRAYRYFSNDTYPGTIHQDGFLVSLLDATGRYPYLQSYLDRTPVDQLVAPEDTLFHEGDALDKDSFGLTPDGFAVSFHDSDKGLPLSGFSFPFSVRVDAMTDQSVQLTIQPRLAK